MSFYEGCFFFLALLKFQANNDKISTPEKKAPMSKIVLVFHISTWDGYDISVQKYETEAKALVAIKKNIHQNQPRVSLIDIVDLEDLDENYSITKTQAFLKLTIKNVNQLFDNVYYHSNIVSNYNELNCIARDESNKSMGETAWLVFDFRGHQYKIEGVHLGKGQISWNELSTFVEVKSQEITQPSKVEWVKV